VAIVISIATFGINKISSQHTPLQTAATSAAVTH
jgi:hypothetical protein